MKKKIKVLIRQLWEIWNDRFQGDNRQSPIEAAPVPHSHKFLDLFHLIEHSFLRRIMEICNLGTGALSCGNCLYTLPMDKIINLIDLGSFINIFYLSALDMIKLCGKMHRKRSEQNYSYLYGPKYIHWFIWIVQTYSQVHFRKAVWHI